MVQLRVKFTEHLVGEDRAGLRCYSTGLWDINPRRAGPFSGRGLSIGLRTLTCEGSNITAELGALSTRLGFVPPSATIRRIDDHTSFWESAPEIVIFAKNRKEAQIAANLLFASLLTIEGCSLVLENIQVTPVENAELEELPLAARSRDVFFAGLTNLTLAAALACKLSRRRRWRYAAMKLWMSHRICSIPPIETDPARGYYFGLERDPMAHVTFAQSIIAAYSAMEELEFEIRASSKNPSKIAGRWNPTVLGDLRGRLEAGGVDCNEDEIWVVRGTKTRIERAQPIADARKAKWSSAKVRDVHMSIFDAIHRASWLRSRVSSHRLTSLANSISPYDVVNVQSLARRLLLEATGFWTEL